MLLRTPYSSRVPGALPVVDGRRYANNNLLYADDKGSLVAVSYKPGSSSVAGHPRTIVEQVGVNPSTYWAAFSVGGGGTLIYHTGVGAPLSQLTWLDRSGKELGTIGDPGVIANPVISPDQTRVAFDLAEDVVEGGCLDLQPAEQHLGPLHV